MDVSSKITNSDSFVLRMEKRWRLNGSSFGITLCAPRMSKEGKSNYLQSSEHFIKHA